MYNKPNNAYANTLDLYNSNKYKDLCELLSVTYAIDNDLELAKLVSLCTLESNGDIEVIFRSFDDYMNLCHGKDL
jgi:hypothetical protein